MNTRISAYFYNHFVFLFVFYAFFFFINFLIHQVFNKYSLHLPLQYFSLSFLSFLSFSFSFLPLILVFAFIPWITVFNWTEVEEHVMKLNQDSVEALGMKAAMR